MCRVLTVLIYVTIIVYSTGAVITTPTTGPLVADVQLLYSQTEPVFAGDFYDVICMANFSTTPTTVEVRQL